MGGEKEIVGSSYILKADFPVGYMWVVRKKAVESDSRILDPSNQMMELLSREVKMAFCKVADFVEGKRLAEVYTCHLSSLQC